MNVLFSVQLLPSRGLSCLKSCFLCFKSETFRSFCVCGWSEGRASSCSLSAHSQQTCASPTFSHSTQTPTVCTKTHNFTFHTPTALLFFLFLHLFYTQPTHTSLQRGACVGLWLSAATSFSAVDATRHTKASWVKEPEGWTFQAFGNIRPPHGWRPPGCVWCLQKVWFGPEQPKDVLLYVQIKNADFSQHKKKQKTF